MAAKLGEKIKRYRAKLRDEGLRALLAKRVRHIKEQWKYDNYVVGRLVETVGRNEVKIGGLRFSVDNPDIKTREKSTIYYGIFEVSELQFVERFLPRDLPVVEFGACIGVVSCSTNRLLRDPEKHIVVEANPAIIPTLKHNRGLNDCKFEIINAAVAYGADHVKFSVGDCFLSNHLGESRQNCISVPSVTLAAIIEKHGFDRISFVVDIEGAELALVANEGELIRQVAQVIILETHPDALGEDGIAKLWGRLSELGFVEVARLRNVVVLENSLLAPRPTGSPRG